MSAAFPDPRALLRRYGLAAKKSFGQNFLVSERVYRAIVDAAVADAADWVVEIGAGLGTLTARLAERVPEGKVIALERDRDLARVLRAELGHLENVDVEETNALTYDLGAVARWRGEPIAVCGNLPYNIASPILFRLAGARRSIARAVVMLQREVGERITAAPGTKAYGALGVVLGLRFAAELVVRARPGAFVPAPRVDSVVLRLTPYPGGATRVPVADEARFDACVHAAFGQRRKTLRNALRARYEADAVDVALTAAGVDGGRRGETLDTGEFAALAAALPAPAGNEA